MLEESSTSRIYQINDNFLLINARVSCISFYLIQLIIVEFSIEEFTLDHSSCFTFL